MPKFNNPLNFEDLGFQFESFGVKIGIKAKHQIHLDEVFDRSIRVLPDNFQIINDNLVDHTFVIRYLDDGNLSFQYNGELSKHKSEKVLFNYLESKIRLTVAEFASSKVFIHAGVVKVNNAAILIPANSFAGKTTLVKEFLKKGATYFSDEYAVLDENGHVHPFPKTLSVRGIIDERQQVEIPAAEFGADTGIKPCEVRLIIFTKYKKDASWSPILLSPGEGVMELIPHTVSIRSNTKFSMHVLNKTATNAIIFKSLRGDANETVKKILDFLN